MKRLLIILILLWSSTGYSATLFDADWATGTGCEATTLRDGIWGSTSVGGGTLCDIMNVIAGDGPSGGPTNFMRLSKNNGAWGSMYNMSSLGAPSEVYIRFWVRIHAWTSSNEHPFASSSSNDSTTGVSANQIQLFQFDGTGTWRFFIYTGPPTYTYGYWKYVNTPALSLDTWYRIEYHLQGLGTSSGTATVRLDGVDVTNKMKIDSLILSDYAAQTTLPNINYLLFNPGDGSQAGDLWDISGLKITDGPDWIGGDDATESRAIVGTSIRNGAMR